MGAVGLPEFDNAPPEKRPEKGLLGIRQALGVFANLRPVRAYASLLDSSPLKNHLVEGTDMIIVRELTGGLYYGTPRGIFEDGAETRAVNTMAYTRAEIERVARVAFHLARGAPQEGHLGRQVQRAGESRSSGGAWWCEVAAELSGRGARSPAGGQLRHAVDPESRGAST